MPPSLTLNKVSRLFLLKQYGLDISDGNQVLLISNVKRMGPAGAPPPGPAMLIPELCYLTGFCIIMSV